MNQHVLKLCRHLIWERGMKHSKNLQDPSSSSPSLAILTLFTVTVDSKTSILHLLHGQSGGLPAALQKWTESQKVSESLGSELQNPTLKLHSICCNGHKAAKNRVKRKIRQSLTATIACQKNRSTARISHFNPQTSLEPQELRCGWTSCPPPSIGHPTPANAAAAKLWDESALNVVVSKFGSLWAPVVYLRFPIRIYSNCICWYPPFCFDKTKSTKTALRMFVSIGSLWCGDVVTEANSLLSPQMVNSWPQFPGPISMKTPILEGEGALQKLHWSGRRILWRSCKPHSQVNVCV